MKKPITVTATCTNFSFGFGDFTIKKGDSVPEGLSGRSIRLPLGTLTPMQRLAPSPTLLDKKAASDELCAWFAEKHAAARKLGQRGAVFSVTIEVDAAGKILRFLNASVEFKESPNSLEPSAVFVKTPSVRQLPQHHCRASVLRRWLWSCGAPTGVAVPGAMRREGFGFEPSSFCAAR